MTPNYAVPVPVVHLPEVVFDMTGGRPVDPDMPRAEPVPVEVLPEVVFDMRSVLGPPLGVTVWLREAAAPAEAEAELTALAAALTEFDRAHGGAGLVLEGSAPDGAAVRLTFRSADGVGAADRLAKLAAAINAAAGSNGLARGPSVERWEAAVLPA